MTKIIVKGKKQSCKYNNNDMYKSIKPEDCEVLKTYAFTYNPIDQPDLKKPNGYSLWYAKMTKLFWSFEYCNLKMNPEISSKGRFHFHGYIQVKSVTNFFARTIPQMQSYGTYEIDTIADFSVWSKYVTKQSTYYSMFHDKEGHKSQHYTIIDTFVVPEIMDEVK